MKKIFLIMMCMFVLCGCKNNSNETDVTSNDIHYISLDSGKAYLDDKQVNEYEHIWAIDLETGEEYFEGSFNETEEVYIAHDVVYYPEIDESQFKLENYNDEMEWVRYYQNDELKDYIFSTLPNLKTGFPSNMMHSASNAYDNPVLHINASGTYVLSGNWHGQIKIDLGEDAYTDESAKVTLILDGVEVTCDVAPALIFENVYEVDNNFEEKETNTNEIDLENAGAEVIIKDGSVNSFKGANVFRILKPVYKKEGSTVQKKLYKLDGAFYSYQSMRIAGEEKGNGILNIESTTYEGLNSELHLQIDGGYINIVSYDDGINVNEDDVSVFKMNDGRLTIFAGLGSEGDVIDSNGFIKINGGTILGTSPSVSDNILDADKGVEVSDEARIIVGGAMNSNFESGFRNQPRDNFFKQDGFHSDNFNRDEMPSDFMPFKKPETN